MELPIPRYGPDIDPLIGRVLVSRYQLADRIGQLGRQISACYSGTEVTIVSVMTGAMIFTADLVRQMPLVARLDLTTISSYPGPATESQGPRFVLPVSADLAGRHVLIVDDILDSGRTLELLVQTVQRQEPASVRTCVLLRKRRDDLVERFDADFVGFEIENEFAVGYGLDFNHLYRNLPDVCVLARHARRPARRAEGRA